MSSVLQVTPEGSLAVVCLQNVFVVSATIMTSSVAHVTLRRESAPVLTVLRANSVKRVKMAFMALRKLEGLVS